MGATSPYQHSAALTLQLCARRRLITPKLALVWSLYYNQDTYTIIKVKRKRIRTKKGEAEINSKRKKFGSRYSE